MSGELACDGGSASSGKLMWPVWAAEPAYLSWAMTGTCKSFRCSYYSNPGLMLCIALLPATVNTSLEETAEEPWKEGPWAYFTDQEGFQAPYQD